MNIGNITNKKSSVINKKIVHHKHLHLVLFFFMLLAEKISEIYPKRKECFFIPESFALN